MQKLLLVFFLVLPSLVYSQATKKVKNSRAGETYHVLKATPSVMHGLYSSKYVEGMYENGKQVGEWKYYDFEGNVVQVYDYTKKQIVMRSPNRNPEKEHKIIQNGDTITTTLDHIAEVMGSEVRIAKTLQSVIDYPLLAKQNGIEGKVYVEFTVDENGLARNHRVKKGIGYGCDEMAIFGVKRLPEPWFPAIKNGKPVTMVYVIPVEFRLN